MGFPQNLAAIMTSTDTTMYRLAKDIGIHQSTVKTWLSGAYEPKLEMLKKLAEYFNVPYSALLGETGPVSNVLRRGPFEFTDDGTPGHTHVSIGPQMRDGELYLPDELLYSLAHLNQAAIQEVCDVAEGLSKLDRSQCAKPAPAPTDGTHDLLTEDPE